MVANTRRGICEGASPKRETSLIVCTSVGRIFADIDFVVKSHYFIKKVFKIVRLPERLISETRKKLY